MRDNRESDKRTIYCTIMNENVEAGFYSRAFYEWRDMFRDDPDEAQEVLRELIQEYRDKEHLMEGVLHILDDFDYDELPLINDFVIEKCYNHKSLVVLDKLISVFENWSNKESLEALRKMSPDREWIEDYRLQVIKDLEEGLT
jgi:hypothetical protein